MSEATDLAKADLAAWRQEKLSRRKARRRRPGAIPRLEHDERCAAFYALTLGYTHKVIGEAFHISSNAVSRIAVYIRQPKKPRTPGGRPIVRRDGYSTSSTFDGPWHSLSEKGRQGSALPPPAATIEPERGPKGAYRNIAIEFLDLGADAFGDRYLLPHLRDRLFKAMQKFQQSGDRV